MWRKAAVFKHYRENNNVKKGKRYKALLEKVDLTKQYSISEAVAIAK